MTWKLLAYVLYIKHLQVYDANTNQTFLYNTKAFVATIRRILFVSCFKGFMEKAHNTKHGIGTVL